jgi:pimeloyl-ACP methyl ester carboxylesterase
LVGKKGRFSDKESEEKSGGQALNTKTQVVVLSSKGEKMNLRKILFWVAFSLIAGEANNSVFAQVATDYSQAANWLSLTATGKAVDIFYIYPTTGWTNDTTTPQICAINNSAMQTGAQLDLAIQASAFETVGNIFAPYYRQANSCPTNRQAFIGGIPTTDGIAAFDYYIKHYNDGRPYILLGHSQGANIASNLLAQYMNENPTAYSRMIAAYVIGYAVTPAYLSQNPILKFAENADDTGVIISYNTEAPDCDTATNPVLYAGVGLVINPISWTRSETLAPKTESLGSYLPNSSGQFVQVPQYADAQINSSLGVLFCSTADEDFIAAISSSFPRGVYHDFDIPLYYFDLRANAANRVKNYLNNSTRRWISDYNGDGTSDFALFRPSSGLWAVRDITRTHFGTSGDLPVSGDYDGDGTTDIAYFRPSNCLWSVLDVGVAFFGQPGDVPVVGDYNGDGTCDVTTFRGSSGLWSIYCLTQIYFGASTDLLVPGDYDGDGTTDIAIFRPSSSMWSARNVTRFYLGLSTDRPVPGDFSGTGKWEGGVFRPSSGMWSVRNVTRVYLGKTDDWALPADYDGNGADDAGIVRDSTGMWSVRNLTRVYFGGTGDVPVTR